MALVSDWTQVGEDVYYRKAELYNMEWGGGLNMSELVVCGAPYGGPIALTWCQDNSLHSRTAQAPATPAIVIFSSAGVKIGTVKCSGVQLLQVGWSQSEELICVHRDGSVSLYDMFGNYKHSFNMGQEAKDAGVTLAMVFDGLQGTGVAVLTATHRVFVIANISDPNPRKYSDIPAGPVQCWAVVREERSLMLLLCQSQQMCWCNAANARADVVQSPLVTDLERSNSSSTSSSSSSIVAVSVCSNQRSVALLAASGVLWLGSSDLMKEYCVHDTRSAVTPRQMAWCGTGSVVVMWEVSLQLITITGAITNFYLESPAHLVQEIDSVRLIGDTKHHILYKVPHVTVSTLAIGSMAAGALLVEAHLGYEVGSANSEDKDNREEDHLMEEEKLVKMKRVEDERPNNEESPRAYDCLALIKGREEEAVQQCMEAARLDLEPSNAKLLLKSAQFGLTFLPPLEPDTVRTTAAKLRILTDLRTKKIGLPLTYPQMERLGLPVLLERLVARRLFPTALAIARTHKDLEDHVPRVLAHWACYKISNPRGQSDEQLAVQVHSKLGYMPGLSYTDIADCANSLGRRQLAVKLLAYECRAKEQVTGLLRLQEHTAALARAQTTGDTDLILTVLQHMRAALPLGDFLMLVRKSPLCRSVYARSCDRGSASSGRDALRDLWVQEDNFSRQALMRVEEAYQATRTDLRLGLLQSAADCYRRAKDDHSTQLTEEQIRLLKCQVGLEEEHHKHFVGLSLHDTLTQLVTINCIKHADKMRADFKVPDKRYWLLRVHAHARANHWQELETFLLNTRKPPIPPGGWETVVDACLEQDGGGRTGLMEARKYVLRVKEENKVEYLRKCGMTEEAERAAELAASVSPLARVMTAAPTLQALFE